MALNPKNFGIAIGRLTRDITRFTNNDGSQKLMIHLAVDNNFLSRDKQRHSQFLDFEAYIPAGREFKVYDLMHKGSMVELQYSLRSNTYERDGQTVYTQTAQIETVQLLESKSAAEARRAAAADEAPFEAPATMDSMAGVIEMPPVD